MMEKSKYMREAIEIASKNASSIEGGPFGAVVVKGDKIIAAAANSVTTALDPTAHAEVNAIRAACKALGSWDLSGCELYASCEPCPMCLSAAYWARVDKIYYAADSEAAAEAGFDDAFIYKELSLSSDERSLPQEQLLPNEGRFPFDLWRDNRERVPY